MVVAFPPSGHRAISTRIQSRRTIASHKLPPRLLQLPCLMMITNLKFETSFNYSPSRAHTHPQIYSPGKEDIIPSSDLSRPSQSSIRRLSPERERERWRAHDGRTRSLFTFSSIHLSSSLALGPKLTCYRRLSTRDRRAAAKDADDDDCVWIHVIQLFSPRCLMCVCLSVCLWALAIRPRSAMVLLLAGKRVPNRSTDRSDRTTGLICVESEIMSRC